MTDENTVIPIKHYQMYNWGYNYENDPGEFEFIVKFSPDFNIKLLHYALSKSKESFQLTIEDVKIPIICGKFPGKISEMSVSKNADNIIFSFTKEEPKFWDFPIADYHDENHDMDPQSHYSLGILYLSLQNKELGQEHFSAAISAHYLIAISALIHEISEELDEENDQKKKLKMITDIVNFYNIGLNYRSPEMARDYGVFMLEHGFHDDIVLRVLDIAIQQGETNSILYKAMALSSLSVFNTFPYKDDSEAVRLLQFFIEKFREDKVPYIAYHLLALHLYNGVGIEMDEDKANSLQEMACKLNPDIEPLTKIDKNTEKQKDVKNNEFLKIIGITGVIACTAMTAFAIFRFMKRRK